MNGVSTTTYNISNRYSMLHNLHGVLTMAQEHLVYIEQILAVYRTCGMNKYNVANIEKVYILHPCTTYSEMSSTPK